MNQPQLNVICWNANGLISCKTEFEAFLHLHDVDIALISEMHLISSASLPKIRNYSIYAANHPSGTPRGGSAVIIKHSLQHNDYGVYVTENIQASVITISLNNRNIRIGSIYCPPNRPSVESQFESLFAHLGEHWILGGDFNAKHPLWGSRLTSPRGQAIHNCVVRFHCSPIAPDSPTFWTANTRIQPDIIDFFITKGLPTTQLKAVCIADLSSDHVPVRLVFYATPLATRTPPPANKTTDWETVRRLMDSQINLGTWFPNPSDLDQAAEHFSSLLLQSTISCTQLEERLPPEITYPDFIRRLVKRRRQARKQWQNHRCSELKTIFNKLARDTTRAIWQWKNASFASYLASLEPTKETNYSLWAATKRIRHLPKTAQQLRRDDSSWTRSDSEKAELFAQHFEQVFRPNDIFSSITPLIPASDDGRIKFTTPLEVATIVDKLKLRKSPGHDQLMPIMLRELSKEGLVYLTSLFNTALRLKYVPQTWKLAKMIVILKLGKPPENPSSYRPISLLSIIAKVFEKVILLRLQTVINQNKIIPDTQFGFRSKHSTIEQIHRVIHVILQALENKEFAPAVFLDISAAFDKVWHEGLIHKIKDHFSPGFCKLLISYLNSRKFFVHYGSSPSMLKTIAAGVPQGSVLGPTLFLLYTIDLQQIPNVTISQFADDTAIIACNADYDSAVTTLQTAVDHISAWAQDWKIALNNSKSVRVDYTLRPSTYIPTTISSEPVPHANSARYLGLHLDSKLNWQEHIANKRKMLDLLKKDYYWLIRPRSNLSLANKRRIYKTIFQPAWSYGAEIWGTAAPSNINRIQVVQNGFLRLITGAPWYIQNEQLHKDLDMETVDAIIHQRANRYFQRLHNHPNSEALVLLDASGDTRRLQRQHQHDLLN